MQRFALRLTLILLVILAAAGAARADVCVTVDEGHDMFSPRDREAAVLMVSKQFELAGEHVAAEGCASPYPVSHIMLGNTILVTMNGPRGTREGKALGMDDLPALYNQMVRSIVTGKPMTGFNVVDRTNVTAAQSSAERVHGDSLWYARLGYGSVFGDKAYAGPSMGLGYRFELDSFGVDVSFLNFQSRSSSGGYNYNYYGPSDNAFSGSLLKIEGLYFVDPKANTSTYVGAGLSWGGTDFGQGWHGSGLQGELTAGYELPRASSLRVFLQADAVLPFYEVSALRYPPTWRGAGPIAFTAEHRYAPSLVFSLGVGWQRNRHGRP